MLNLLELLESTKDHVPDAIDKAKDYAPKITKAVKKKLPSSREIDHMQMKWDGKIAEELMRAMPKRVKRFGIAKMILLPVAAAATALLFAPKSGKELRTDIKNYFSDLKEDCMDAFQDVKAEIQEEDFSIPDLVSKQAKGHSSAEDDPSAGVGNVKGTPFEPDQDETVPADQLDEALEDMGVDSEDELDDKK